MKPLFDQYTRVHLVGIGGVGMEGLARVLREMGCQVSGSDRVGSKVLSDLRRDGFDVHAGHRAEQVRMAELVVFSTAVPACNEELTEARRLGIGTVSRGELLGELTRSFLTLAVAGSHGKTTSASMLAEILRRADLQPSVLIGGWRQGRAQAELGKGRFFVVEADEFQRSFLRLYPSWSLVTSVDAEHLDCYADLAAVEEAFCRYLARLPFYGHCVLAGDGRVGKRVLAGLERPHFTYGMEEGNDFRAQRIEFLSWGSRFEMSRGETVLGKVELQVPGEHNLRNALGAASLACTLGVGIEPIARGLRSFGGVARRFERRGEVGGVLVVDDYAHHPTEVAAALKAARQSGRRVVAVFQPHLYSRTRALGAEFAEVLSAADQVLLTEIYPSREEPLPGVSAEMIVRAMRENGFQQVRFVPDKELVPDLLLENCRCGDLIITLGAGDIEQVVETFLDKLRMRLE